MIYLNFFLEAPGFFCLVAILGLLVGSFLNVVIHRLPIMLERSWRRDCEAFLGLPQSAAETSPYNLCVPRSSCPHCDKRIPALQNIPVLSYLMLRGRCAHCNGVIDFRYPLVEIITALLSLAVVWRFDLNWQSLVALALCWSLIVLAFIDIEHMLLPDVITQPLLWAGLGVNLFAVFCDQTASLLGAMGGYLSLWSVQRLYSLIRNKEGMGQGDFKLLAALGAWLGWEMLLPLIMLSTLLALSVALAMLKRNDYQQPFPFGPFLAISGVLLLLWGSDILVIYREMLHV